MYICWNCIWKQLATDSFVQHNLSSSSGSKAEKQGEALRFPHMLRALQSPATGFGSARSAAQPGALAKAWLKRSCLCLASLLSALPSFKAGLNPFSSSCCHLEDIQNTNKCFPCRHRYLKWTVCAINAAVRGDAGRASGLGQPHLEVRHDEHLQKLSKRGAKRQKERESLLHPGKQGPAPRAARPPPCSSLQCAGLGLAPLNVCTITKIPQQN